MNRTRNKTTNMAPQMCDDAQPCDTQACEEQNSMPLSEMADECCETDASPVDAQCDKMASK